MAVPIGYAAAQEIAGNGSPPDRIPISECPKVQAEFEEAGSAVETVANPCPDQRSAAAAAQELGAIRRNGLAHILEGMRAHGASAEEMAPLQAELEQRREEK